MDIPDSVLGQLGNRIQHALRAYTPKEQKAIRAAASSFRENPSFDTEEAITDLGVGEALVSMLDIKGVPGVVGRTLIRPRRPLALALPRPLSAAPFSKLARLAGFTTPSLTANPPMKFSKSVPRLTRKRRPKPKKKKLRKK